MLRWEIDGKVSTPESIFGEIKAEMARPVGIVVYGADCELKEKVVGAVIGSLPGLATSNNAAPTPTLVKYIQNNDMVAIILTPEEAAIHGLRHELVKVMRNAGANSMVGIYAKCRKPAPLPGRGFLKPKVAGLAKQIAAIERSNPNADGLEHFVVVTEEEG